jgi:RimJ/RimL family protein N-acetyltransferase
VRLTEQFLLEHSDHVAPFTVDDAVLTAHITALTGAPYLLQPVTPSYFASLSDSDFQALADVANEPLIRSFYWTADRTALDMREFLAYFRTCWRLKRYGACGVIINTNLEIRGVITLEASEGGIAFMYWISDADRGVMTPVLQHIIAMLGGEQQINAEVNQKNTRSQNLLRRLGFHLESPREPDSEFAFWVLPKPT